MSAFRSYRLFTLLVLIFAGAMASSAQSDRDAGIEHYRSGNYKEALSILGKLVDEKTADRQTHLYLAASYIKLGRASEAVKIFKKLKKAKPSKDEIKYDRKYKIINNPRAACSYERGDRAASARVAVELGPEGRIGFVTVFASSGRQFAKNAAEAAGAVTFEPAILNGTPVATIVEVEYRCSMM